MKREKLAKSLWLTIFAFITSCSATAQTVENQNDSSLLYMRIIFGDVVNFLTGGQGPENPDTVLGAMAQTFNAAMTTLVFILILWVSFNAFFSAAHTGQIDEKKYDKVFLPIRMILAMVIIIPVAGGFNAMQMGVFWVSGKGINMANKVYESALDLMESSGSITQLRVDERHEQVSIDILTNLVCVQGINAITNHININGVTLKSGVTTSHSQRLAAGISYDGVYSRYGIGVTKAAISNAISRIWDGENFSGEFEDIRHYPPQACGSLRLGMTGSSSDLGFSDVKGAYFRDYGNLFGQTERELVQLASQIVDHGLGAGPAPDPNMLANIISNYANTHKDLAADLGHSIAAARASRWGSGGPEVTGSTLNAREAGWVSAGAFYWDWSRMTQETNKILREPYVQTTTTHSVKILSDADMRKIYEALEEYINLKRNRISNNGLVSASTRQAIWSNPYIGERTQASQEGDEERAAQKLTVEQIKNETLLLDSSSSLRDTFVNGQSDPLTHLIDFGHQAIVNAEIAILMLSTLEALKKWSEPGQGGALDKVTTGWLIPVFAGFDVLTKMAFIFIIAALTLGITCAFYIPSIPLIQWFMGVVSYYALLIEAVIVATVHAAAHASPEGQGLTGDRAKAGYMILIGLLLRPTLMLFGFFSSISLLMVMGELLFMIWSPFVAGLTAEHITGLVSFFAIIGLQVAVMIGLAQRCFALVNEISDKVLRYIGGGAESLGDAQAMSNTQSQFNVVGSVIQSTASAANNGSQNASQQRKADSPPRESKQKINSSLTPSG